MKSTDTETPHPPEHRHRKKGFLCFKPAITWEEMPPRNITSNEERKEFPDNKISTSKYTALTFLPKNLFYQFSKLANIYFVLVGCLQFITAISTSGGIPYIFIPLTCIICVSALKDLLEDLKRHRSDNEENNKKVKVFFNGQFVDRRWRDIRVGNIVKIHENEFFPADMLILNTNGKKGQCYIETKNLDGETNLKDKVALKELMRDFADDTKISSAKSQFDYEKPNPLLYTFKGSITTTTGPLSLNEKNFVLRGCSLRNTGWAIGLVAYSGHHTKIMLNSIRAKGKFSKLEVQMNRQIMLVFIVQLLFCIFSGFYNAIWYEMTKNNLSYLHIDRSSYVDNSFGYNLFVRLGNWLLLFTNFVPISLLVTLEVVKVFQGYNISKDPKLHSKESDIWCSVQTSNLNEELGQVEYIFSDKTGTLTCNQMEFKNICIAGTSYGEDRRFQGKDSLAEVTNVDFLDQTFFDNLRSNNPEILEALLGLAICHTIITEEKEGKVIYNASSPDELALVNFAKYVGYEYKGIDEQNNIQVSCNGQIANYKLLYVLEFNSTRKRMSVVVQDPKGQTVLYTKGADSIIWKRLSEKTNNKAILTATQKHLDRYAVTGLRTLVIAKRVLDPQLFNKWNTEYSTASRLIEGREEALEMLQEQIEVDLQIIGSTAIEDKLQDEVGYTIKKLKESGIKVWVLTGDKVETAINIGYSCQLLNDDLHRLEITEQKEEEIRAKIKEILAKIEGKTVENSNFAMIISGDALVIAMKPDLSHFIMQIGSVCKAVLCCRVSPKQKQEIVSLVRKHKPHVTTLAIGDGANDVNMITAAHVGIGIRGVEGQQAARASDYAIGEFKFLHRILYYYGRECYRRNSYLVLYNFYKNIAVVLPQFWFAFLNGMSGQTLYDQLIFQFYNVFFTAAPIMVYAIWDEEKPDHELMTKSYNYHIGMKSELFNTKKFWIWFFNGAWQAVIFAYVAFNSMDSEIGSKDGALYGFYDIGAMVLMCVIVVVNVKVLLFSNTYHFLNIFCIFGGILLYILGIMADSALYSTAVLYKEFAHIFQCGNFFIGVFITIVATNFVDYAIQSYEGLSSEDANKVTFSEENVELQTLIPLNGGSGSVSGSHSPLHDINDETTEKVRGRIGENDTVEYVQPPLSVSSSPSSSYTTTSTKERNINAITVEIQGKKKGT
jgi:phospholipid-transporting ATPase